MTTCEVECTQRKPERSGIGKKAETFPGAISSSLKM